MKWWQQTVIYQIYPRSFQDSNGDGVGDLQGIIQRLDYLEKLGIGAIWLSPIYQSPNDDNGYDISDYEAIMAEFGTMSDMEQLLLEAKKNNPAYREYYIWRDPVESESLNDISSVFGGSAWEFDSASGQYYLHLFSKKQPDLNWENEKVRHEIYDMMNFWLDKGIGGFRMDVIDLISKDLDKKITANGPKLHEYLQEMNAATFGRHDVMTVGETWGATPDIAKLYSDPDRDELSMVFQFEHTILDQQEGKEKWDLKPLDVAELKAVLFKWQIALGNQGWNSLFWNNHDLPRIISRWGDDQEYRVESGKMLAILLHMMKGTPYIYQGEEIGMTNRPIQNISEVDDIESINMYHERLAAGFTETEIIASINAKGRDNARTPMQWDDKEHGGFTTGTPWLSINPNYHEINVDATLADPDSIFYMYQKLIRLRKENPLLVLGDFEVITSPTNVFCYTRRYQGEEWLIVANFSAAPVAFELPKRYSEVIISNYAISVQMKMKLRPYEAFVLR